MSVDLSNYIEVHERITAFYAKYPEGSLQGSYEVVEVAGDTFLVYRAEAFRSPEDARPGIGYAWEPVPGLTPYTKNSELMVGETSAWGRAIAALGFEVQRGIASREEVSNRANGEEANVPMSDKQKGFLKRLLKDKGADPEQQQLVLWFAEEKLSGGRGGSASKAIDGLKGDNPDETMERLLTASLKFQRTQTDIPADTEGLEDVDGGKKDLTDIPF